MTATPILSKIVTVVALAVVAVALIVLVTVALLRGLAVTSPTVTNVLGWVATLIGLLAVIAKEAINGSAIQQQARILNGHMSQSATEAHPAATAVTVAKEGSQE